MSGVWELLSVNKPNKKIARKLLIGYFFIYPFYYVIAMFLAVLILKFYFDWSYSFSKKIFYMYAGIMWFASYVTHFDIFKLALNISNSGRSTIKD